MGKGHKFYWFEGTVLHVDKSQAKSTANVDKLRGIAATDVVVHNESDAVLSPELHVYLGTILSAIKASAPDVVAREAASLESRVAELEEHPEEPRTGEVDATEGPTVEQFRARFAGLVDALEECRGFLALHHSHERGGPHSPTKGVSKLLLAKVESALEAFK